MASTFTTNLRVELQGTGDHRSSWGAVANTGLSLLEEGISKLITIDIPDANLTLSATNGASDQSRPMFLVFTGALTADRTVQIPNVSKLYFMRNTTTGNKNIIVSNQVAGTSITIPPSGSPGMQWKVVFTDGTNCYSNDAIITPSSGAQRWGLAGYIDPNGFMEVGTAFDFHNNNLDANDFNVRLSTNATATDLFITPQGGSPSKVWNDGNDGTGSGLDADMVDGRHAADLGFPAATSMLFWQSAAPTGWTKITTHNDKALRVVSGTVTSGGTTTFSSVFTNRVPSGSIGGTAITEAQLPAHDHFVSGSTGTESANHTHGVNINSGGESTQHTHAGALNGQAFVTYAGGGGGQGTTGGGYSTSGNTNWNDRSHYHNVSGNTGTVSAFHTHAISFFTQNAGSGQTHSHTFAGTNMDFNVAYVDIIIATKNP